MKLPEGSEGRPSFGRTPSFFQKAARGEASRRTFRKKLLPSGTSGASFGKPPEVKLPEGSRRTPPEVKLPEGRSESRRTRFFQNKFIKPPEVKLLSESLRTCVLPKEGKKPARGKRASFRKRRKRASRRKRKKFSFLQKAARGEASRRKRRTPFLREEAEGRAFFNTSWLPSERESG